MNDIIEENKGIMPADLKVSNRQTILNIYRSGKSLTASEVSASIGLSRQTVAKAIDYFVEKGILCDGGKGSSTESGGRKPRNYELSRKVTFVSVNIGEQSIHLALFNLYSEILYETDESVSHSPSFGEIREAVRTAAERILEHNPEGNRIYGLSVIIRGLVDSENKTLRYSPYYPDWERNVSFDCLLEYFPGASFIALDKPARTFARYELNTHPDEYARRRVLILFLRGGMAGATIDRGHIENGRNSIIGEFSYMYLNSEKKKNMADVMKTSEITANMEQYRDDDPDSVIFRKKDLTLTDIFEASASNDMTARKADEYAAVLFSAMIHNINLAFDADTIILLGEYAAADEHFLEILKKEISRFVYYPENYIPDIRTDRTPLERMLLEGSVFNMLHQFYKEPSLYTDED